MSCVGLRVRVYVRTWRLQRCHTMRAKRVKTLEPAVFFPCAEKKTDFASSYTCIYRCATSIDYTAQQPGLCSIFHPHCRSVFCVSIAEMFLLILSIACVGEKRGRGMLHTLLVSRVAASSDLSQPPLSCG